MANSASSRATPPDLGRNPVARYIQLSTLFRRMIDSGQWPLEARIPTVDELALEYGVARATIRQALGLLEDEGLIARYRAKGTFVVNRPAQDLWCEVSTDWSGLLTARDGALIEILSDERATQPPLIPHRIGKPSPVYRHLRRRHSRNGKPFLLADIYLDEGLCRKLTKKDLTTKTALRLISDIPGVKIKDARQTLTIKTADLDSANLLKMPLNAPVARVHRTAVDQRGVLILIAEGIYRGDVVSIDIKLR